MEAVKRCSLPRRNTPALRVDQCRAFAETKAPSLSYRRVPPSSSGWQTSRNQDEFLHRCQSAGCWWSTMTWTCRQPQYGCVPRAATAATMACGASSASWAGTKSSPDYGLVRINDLVHVVRLPSLVRASWPGSNTRLVSAGIGRPPGQMAVPTYVLQVCGN